MSDLNMADGLARLLRLVPGITLDNRAIKMLSEGKINEVMTEFNEKKEGKVVEKVEEKPKKSKKKRSVSSYIIGKNDKGIKDNKD